MPKSRGQRPSRWLVALALYLIILLLIVLTFAATEHGFCYHVLTANFMPLGVPGCNYSMADRRLHQQYHTLGQSRLTHPPLHHHNLVLSPLYRSCACHYCPTLPLTSGIFLSVK